MDLNPDKKKLFDGFHHDEEVNVGDDLCVQRVDLQLAVALLGLLAGVKSGKTELFKLCRDRLRE